MPQTSKSELITALEMMEREKGVPKEAILKMIEDALVSALRKHVGKNAEIEAQIDPATAHIRAWQVMRVVEQITDPDIEITPDRAARRGQAAPVGETVRFQLDPREFARIAAQTAKQVLVQKIREMERDNLYEEYKPREGEVVSGSVHRFYDRNIIVDIGKAEAILPLREQIRKERYGPGDRVRAIILKVDKAQRGPQVVLSRAHPKFLEKIFETEVPEVAERIVELVKVERDPGFRAKVVVRSNNPKVDPVGACVGIRGSRIRSIMNELSGERIDLINAADDTQQFIANALSPAKVLTVRVLDLENKRAEVIVPDDQLAIAIGREGHNVRLACRLTGWSLDVKSEAQKAEQKAQVHDAIAAELTELDGVGPKLAETLIKAGVSDIGKLAGATVEQLITLQGVGEQKAHKIIESAKEFVSRKALGTPEAALAEAGVPPAAAPEAEEAPAEPAAEEAEPPQDDAAGETGTDASGEEKA